MSAHLHKTIDLEECGPGVGWVHVRKKSKKAVDLSSKEQEYSFY